jgi:phosphoribosylformylglycinamidine synthase
MAVPLFSESTGRFIIEVRPEDTDALETLMSAVLCVPIGKVASAQHLSIESGSELANKSVLDVSLSELEQAWRGAIPAPAIAPTPPTDARRKTMLMHSVSTRVGQPHILILHANGTNRDRDAYLACQLAGGKPEIVHVNQLLTGERHLHDYHMLVVPGGFSYGDDLGAGRLWALDLRQRLGQQVEQFIADGRPVLGICNGFQALVKAGLLPGDSPDTARPVTLTFNQSGHFECRWVHLLPNPQSHCLFTEGLSEPIYCPVAHGEGCVAARDHGTLDALWQDGLAALIYVDTAGQPAQYPVNPNGSAYNIAALTNPGGNVLGLMPHPEDHIFPWQHPRWHRGESGFDGLRLFQNGVKYA